MRIAIPRERRSRRLCAGARLRAGGRLRRALIVVRRALVALLITCIPAGAAMAQIYVVIEPDGTRRFTNQPTNGAQVFLETHYSLDPAAVLNRGPIPFAQEIVDASAREGLDAKLVEAVIATESSFDATARSVKGAQGLMQLMPDTARRFGVADVWDPEQNIAGGTAYLRQLLDMFNGDLRLALAAYNAGEGAVERYGGVPPYQETRQYIDRVFSYYRSVGGDPFSASETR